MILREATDVSRSQQTSDRPPTRRTAHRPDQKAEVAYQMLLEIVRMGGCGRPHPKEGAVQRTRRADRKSRLDEFARYAHCADEATKELLRLLGEGAHQGVKLRLEKHFEHLA